MAKIKLAKVEKFFKSTQVLNDINLEIADGDFVVFVGPSGCGKSTLLRIIAGLEDVSSGEIFIDDQEVSEQGANVRGLSMVFQSYALYPHMTVRKNLGFALKTIGLPKKQIDSKVDQVANILQLSELLKRYPKELSGGQRQRVAIGRAIVRDPKAFLFDEPLSNLDAALRVNMRYEIAKIHQKLKSTMIYVTHDQIEAMTLADKIVVLNRGQIIQTGSPKEIYEKPNSLFVAEFIGTPKMNIFSYSMNASNNLLKLKDNSKIKKDLEKKLKAHPNILLGIRPDDIKLVKVSEGHLTGKVEVIEYTGAENFYYVRVGENNFIIRDSGEVKFKVEQKVGLMFNDKKIYYFSQETKNII